MVQSSLHKYTPDYSLELQLSRPTPCAELHNHHYCTAEVQPFWVDMKCHCSLSLVMYVKDSLAVSYDWKVYNWLSHLSSLTAHTHTHTHTHTHMYHEVNDIMLPYQDMIIHQLQENSHYHSCTDRNQWCCCSAGGSHVYHCHTKSLMFMHA